MQLNDVLDEIRSGVTQHSDTTVNSDITDRKTRNRNQKPKEGTDKNDKREPRTKEEIEAYKERKRREEEDKYLRDQKQTKKRGRRRKQEDIPHKEISTEDCVVKERKPRTVRKPKILQPLQPLYFLDVPGLPKGDYLAVCLVHGNN